MNGSRDYPVGDEDAELAQRRRVPALSNGRRRLLPGRALPTLAVDVPRYRERLHLIECPVGEW